MKGFLALAAVLMAAPASAQFMQPHNYMEEQYNQYRDRAYQEQQQRRQNQWQENQNRHWGSHGEDQDED